MQSQVISGVLGTLIGAMASASSLRTEPMTDRHSEPATAEYRVVLRSRWTVSNFPFEYPEGKGSTGAHFSGLIGAAHDARYALFHESVPPTLGIERLSEQGKHTPLDEEVRSAIAKGTASSLFQSGPLLDFGDSLVVATVRVDQNHPLVSIVAMIAPSPDWFAAVSNVSLFENGAWVASKTVDLYAYDSGGDDGTTFRAKDVDTSPKKPIMRARTRHFMINGRVAPVATVVITRK